MEDAATSEISRTQIWQWVHHQAKMDDGQPVTMDMYERFLNEEMDSIRQEIGAQRFDGGHFDLASRLFTSMIRDDQFTEFLTLPAYAYLNGG